MEVLNMRKNRLETILLAIACLVLGITFTVWFFTSGRIFQIAFLAINAFAVAGACIVSLFER